MSQLFGRLGRRGAALLFFTLLDIVYCVGLIAVDHPLTAQYTWMNELLPLPVWAALWGAVGLICLAFSFARYDTPAFMAAVALKVLWGLLSLFGWLSGAVDRGYVSATIWLGFAAFVFLIAGGIPPPHARQSRPVRQSRFRRG